jgi:multidrug efflux pump subunit AcrA (membrane-fusion protein)
MSQSVGSWCLLVALALTLLPARVEAQAGPGAPAVGVVRAERQQITETDEFIGRIQAVNRVALVARVTGFLEQQLYAEGAEVKKGDLLYQIEKPPFQAAVDAARATVDQMKAQHRNAQVTLQRAQTLLNTPAGQQSNVDAALASERALAAQIAGAQAQLETALINLGYTEIRAPIDGKISETALTEGNVVSPTSGTLATIVSQDPMSVRFSISLREGLDLRARYAKQRRLQCSGNNAAPARRANIRATWKARLYLAQRRGEYRYHCPARKNSQPGASGHDCGAARFSRIVGWGIRNRAAGRRAAGHGISCSTRCSAVGSTGRLCLCR